MRITKSRYYVDENINFEKTIENTKDFSELSWDDADLYICVDESRKRAVLEIAGEDWIPDISEAGNGLVLIRFAGIYWMPLMYENERQLAGYIEDEGFVGKAILALHEHEGSSSIAYEVASDGYENVIGYRLSVGFTE